MTEKVKANPDYSVGDIRRGRDIGFKSGHLFIYSACEECGLLRWVLLWNHAPANKICRPCAARRARGPGRASPGQSSRSAGLRAAAAR